MNRIYRYVKFNVYKEVCFKGREGMGAAWGSFCSWRNCFKQNIDHFCLWCRQHQCLFFSFDKSKSDIKTYGFCGSFFHLMRFMVKKKKGKIIIASQMSGRLPHSEPSQVWVLKDKLVNIGFVYLIPSPLFNRWSFGSFYDHRKTTEWGFWSSTDLFSVFFLTYVEEDRSKTTKACSHGCHLGQ